MSTSATLQSGESLLTKKQLADLLKLSPRSIDRKIDAGEFPRGLKLGGAVRWRRSVINAWLAADCPAQDRDK